MWASRSAPGDHEGQEANVPDPLALEGTIDCPECRGCGIIHDRDKERAGTCFARVVSRDQRGSVGPRRASGPRPRRATTSPSRNTISPRLIVSTGQPVTSQASDRRVIGIRFEVGGPQGLRHVRVPDDEVGLRADGDRALAGGEPEQRRRVGRRAPGRSG